MQSATVQDSGMYEGVAAWPGYLAGAWRRRVGQLLRPGATDAEHRAAELRAFAELSPSNDPLRSMVRTWPEDDQRKFVRLVDTLVEIGQSRIDSERRAFVALVAEHDALGVWPLDVEELIGATAQ